MSINIILIREKNSKSDPGKMFARPPHLISLKILVTFFWRMFSSGPKPIQNYSKRCKNMFLYVFEFFFIILGHLGSFLSNLKFFDFSLYGPLLNPRGGPADRGPCPRIPVKNRFFFKWPKNHPKPPQTVQKHVFSCF